jgi:hypothetical protein
VRETSRLVESREINPFLSNPFAQQQQARTVAMWIGNALINALERQ